MPRRKYLIHAGAALAAICLALVFTACSSSADTATAGEVAVPAVTDAAASEQTEPTAQAAPTAVADEPEPTATPVPATVTPEPTSTPEPVIPGMWIGDIGYFNALGSATNVQLTYTIVNDYTDWGGLRQEWESTAVFDPTGRVLQETDGAQVGASFQSRPIGGVRTIFLPTFESLDMPLIRSALVEGAGTKSTIQRHGVQHAEHVLALEEFTPIFMQVHPQIELREASFRIVVRDDGVVVETQLQSVYSDSDTEDSVTGLELRLSIDPFTEELG